MMEQVNKCYIIGTKLQVKYCAQIFSVASQTPPLLAGGTAEPLADRVPSGEGIIPSVNSVSDIVKTFDYCGNAIYENKVLTKLLIDGGYVSFAKTGTGTNAIYTPTYHFYMRDHLGSNRVVASAAGVAEQENHLTIKYTLTKYY